MILDGVITPFELAVLAAAIVTSLAIWTWFRRASANLRRADRELRARNAELEVIRQVNLGITSTLDLPQVLQQVLQGVLHFASDAQNAHIYLYHHDHLTFGAALWSDGHVGEQIAIPRPNGLTATVARTGETIQVSDMDTHPLFATAPPQWRGAGAIMGMPLKIGEHVVGVMNVAFGKPRRFSEEDTRALHSLADQAAVAIANARLHERVQTSEQDHRTLVENIPVGIYRTTPGAQGEFLMANPAYLEILGFGSLEELQKVHVADVYPNPAERKYFSDLVLRARRVENYEQQLKRLDGSLIWGLVTAQVVYQDGDPAYFDCSLIDITVRKRAVEELGVLNRIASAANRATAVDDLLAEICDTIVTSSLAPDAFTIGLFDPATQEMDFRVQVDSGKHEPPERSPLSSTPITALVVTSKKPVLITDWEERRDVLPTPIYFGTMKLPRTWLGVPMMQGDQVIGALSIQSYQPNAYGQQEEQLLGTIADQVVIAIERARSFAAERAAVEKAEALRHAAQAVSSSLEPDQVLRILLQQLKRVLVYDSASVLLVSETHEPALVVGIGYANEETTSHAAGQMLKTSPVLRRMARDLQPILFGDVRQQPDWIWVPGAEHVRSFLAVPILSRDRMTGALMVDSQQSDFFKPADLQTVQTLAQHIAVSIENAQLFTSVERQVHQLTLLREIDRAINSISDLSRMLDTILETIQQLVPSDRATIAMLEGTMLRAVVARGISPAVRKHLVFDVSKHRLFQDLTTQRTWVTLSNVNTSPDWINVPGMDDVQTWLAAPLVARDTFIGQINVYRTTSTPFTTEQGDLLLAFANHAAIAITNLQLRMELHEQARRDSLTQVLNHRTLIAELHNAVAECQSRGESLSFIMLDIDGFKQYNDTFGHVIGDWVLMMVAQAIGDHVGQTGFAGRWGGEEFAIVRPDADPAAAYRVAEQIRVAVASLMIEDRQGRRVPAPTVSQGIATLPITALTAQDLVEQADRAVYRAKHGGKNQIAVAQKK